jgi:hypothetical protein
MAVIAQMPLLVNSWPAGADLSGSQFYFVELASGEVTVCNDVTDVPIGVLQNKPTAGQSAEVVMLGSTKVSADAAITEGALIGCSADGQAEAKVIGTDTTEYVCGRVLEAASNAGEIIQAEINCIAPFRAT